MIIEACVGNLESALKAEKLGADQIELCDRLDLDGISPKFHVIKEICEKLTIPIKVIVNPKPFNYNYKQEDIAEIINYIKLLNQLKLGGIVFGPLDEHMKPDLDLLRMVKSHTDLPITFHKAIDQSNDLLESVKMLRDAKIIDFILSSGGRSTALEGINELKEMNSLLKDSDIELIAAGSITNSNLSRIHDKLKLNYYHGKQIVGVLT